MHIVGGIHRRKTLFSPKSEATRPTSERLREALFNICQQEVEGAKCLDLFAGSGALGLEALSRGAKSAVFVENHRPTFLVLKKNIALLQAESLSETLFQDVVEAINKLGKAKKTFDLIFADPPYGALFKGKQFLAEVVIEAIIANNLLAPSGNLFLEEGTDKIRVEWPSLTLQSLRRYGSSYLYHFTLNDAVS